ncbi:hypothetical protein PG993_012775 [Apiospora rasikravindrae]|uniref:C2H2-type domain-containing protein n=1 Tax=Apiospora rasikravindrae TaxID=990691 RepID=A0ABR1RVW1_9PEZI
MCSTVHFTYRCGCADKVVFKCLLPHLHHLHHDVHQDQDHPEQDDQMEIADDDNQAQQNRVLDEPPPETPLPVPSITITMATSLDEECQDCIANRQSATATAKLDDSGDNSSSSNSNTLDSPQASPPLSVREEGEMVFTAAAATEEPMLPPPLVLQCGKRGRCRDGLASSVGGMERHGLREIPLNMV